MRHKTVFGNANRKVSCQTFEMKATLIQLHHQILLHSGITTKTAGKMALSIYFSLYIVAFTLDMLNFY